MTAPKRGLRVRNVAPESVPVSDAQDSPAAPAVVGLVVGDVERARIRAGLVRHARVFFASTIAEARTLVRNKSPLAAVLAEPRDADGRLTAGWIRTLVCSFPNLAVIGYCRAGHQSAQDILAFANAGAHDLLFHGVDDSGAGLRRVLESASQASAAARIEQAIAGLLPERAEAIMLCCINYPHTARTVQAVASALGCNRKTLSKYCSSHGAPSPEALVSWSRLFLAAAALELGTRTVEAVALELDFASATGLRNLLRRHSGLSPRELRRKGMAALRSSFADTIEASRRTHEQRASAPAST